MAVGERSSVGRRGIRESKHIATTGMMGMRYRSKGNGCTTNRPKRVRPHRPAWSPGERDVQPRVLAPAPDRQRDKGSRKRYPAARLSDTRPTAVRRKNRPIENGPTRTRGPRRVSRPVSDSKPR
jgi:hypothetical protein